MAYLVGSHVRHGGDRGIRSHSNTGPLPKSTRILLNCLFDGMKLISSSLRRNDPGDAKIYADRMFLAAEKLNRYKGLASQCHDAAFSTTG